MWKGKINLCACECENVAGGKDRKAMLNEELHQYLFSPFKGSDLPVVLC